MRAFYITILLLLLAGGLAAQAAPNGPLVRVRTYQGENVSNEYFGNNMISGNFNGDQYDDLIVKSYYTLVLEQQGSFHRANGSELFYYKGSATGLPPTSADQTIMQTLPDTLLAMHAYVDILNVHDMNGDGLDDIGYNKYCSYTVNDTIHVFYQVCIDAGGAVLDSLPIFTYTPPYGTGHYQNSEQPPIFALGDINGDNLGDIGFAAQHYYPEGHAPEAYYWDVFIIYGGSFRMEYFTTFSTQKVYGEGLGDINGDGYNDFYLGTRGYGSQTSLDPDACHIYFGGPQLHNEPDMLLTADMYPGDDEFELQNVYPIGDFNNDGYADFCSCLPRLISQDDWGLLVWYGGPQPSVYPNSRILYPGPCDPIHGDINGDGISDVVADYSMDNLFVLYIGGYRNGIWDLITYAPNEMAVESFGSGKSIGDYNGDGCDDIAAGAPYTLDEKGRVYIYEGNRSLHETNPNITQANSNTAPPVKPTFTAYPNPFNPEVKFAVNSSDFTDMSVDIYNAKGQKITHLPATQHSVVWQAKGQPSGIYFAILKQHAQTIATQKITLLK